MMTQSGILAARVAIDLGAESGRIALVWLDMSDRQFEFAEVHRFPNHMLRLPSGWHWDIGGLWSEILTGLREAKQVADRRQLEIRSAGVDCWGVDWCLLDEAGELLGLPHAYRDPRNSNSFDLLTRRLTPREIYDVTGIQVMPINSLFSLHAMSLASKALVGAAARLLFLPDLIHFWLSGVQANEATIASTSQLVDRRTNSWQPDLLSLAGVDFLCVQPFVEPGTVLGPLREEVLASTGLDANVRVILPASHDTASAVAAIPADGGASWCFLSSGTWSLFGAEIPEPCLNDDAARFMFTNEKGVAGTTRFLKNIAGLWLVQQCRADLSQRDPEHSPNYEELGEMAALAEPFRTLIDPDKEDMATPGGMLEKIEAFAIATDQPVPETAGDYVRCCLDSLALACRATLERLETTLDRRFETIHVVGGGSLNTLHCQMIADATGRDVVAGPVEATAIGNGLVQAMGDGQIADLETLRSVVRNSISLKRYRPGSASEWDEAAVRFAKYISASS